VRSLSPLALPETLEDEKLTPLGPLSPQTTTSYWSSQDALSAKATTSMPTLN